MLPSLVNVNHEEVKEPFFIYKPESLSKNIKEFLNGFNGKTLYAVKTNPSKFILQKIYKLGVRSFDVASINEVKLIKNLFKNANIFFKNPIKPRYAIQKAYFDYFVRHFSLDTEDELKKILESTNFAQDLCLHLRISISNNFSKIKLNKKFGIDGIKAIKLLKKIKSISKKVGVSFHTGSQCMSPIAYKMAISKSFELIKKANVEVNYFNVGGGFPSKYPNMKPKSLKKYLSLINSEFLKHFKKDTRTILLSEPGRAIVSNCMSLVVRVDLRKRNNLFINDGVYGYMHDAAINGFIHKVSKLGKRDKSRILPFSFYGPTCDANDFIKGPFYLPNSIREGDYIKIEEMGAYTVSKKSDFNGFFSYPKVFEDKD